MIIPTVLMQSPQGERAYDLYSRLLSDRIVFLGSAIDEQVANLVVGQLLHLEAENPSQRINLYINSPGGEMTGFFAIVDTMQFIQAPVATSVTWQTLLCSAAYLTVAISMSVRIRLHRCGSSGSVHPGQAMIGNRFRSPASRRLPEINSMRLMML